MLNVTSPVYCLHDIVIGLGLVWLIILRVLQQHLVHVRGGVLEQLHNIVSLHWSPDYLSKYLVVGVEDDDGYLTVAQNTQLISFLHQTKFPLGEGHLSVPLVGYPRDVDLLPAHVGQSPCI